MRLLFQRLLWLLPTLWLNASLVFTLTQLIPGDPLDLMAGEQATLADRESLRRSLRLHHPLFWNSAVFASLEDVQARLERAVGGDDLALKQLENQADAQSWQLRHFAIQADAPTSRLAAHVLRASLLEQSTQPSDVTGNSESDRSWIQRQSLPTTAPGEMARAVTALRLSRYGGFLEALLTGNLRSLHSRRPVSSLLVERAPMTLLLGLSALLLGLLIAIPAGVLAARRPHSWMDLTATLGTMVVMSMPTFWLGPLLLRLFSVDLNWFPVSGADGWRSLILPASTLGLGLSALLTRQIRAGMLEVLSADHIRAARARGLPETRVLFRHALRCAALPLVTLVGLQFGAVLSGSIIIEEIFGWPGLGRELVDAIRGRDFPLIQGCVFLMSAAYALGSLLAELLSSVLNPLLREDR